MVKTFQFRSQPSQVLISEHIIVLCTLFFPSSFLPARFWPRIKATQASLPLARSRGGLSRTDVVLRVVGKAQHNILRVLVLGWPMQGRLVSVSSLGYKIFKSKSSMFLYKKITYVYVDMEEKHPFF